MPRAKGYRLKALRLDRDHVSFDYTYAEARVRGTVTLEALTALLQGTVDRESNLPPNIAPVRLADFSETTYTPIITRKLPNPRSLTSEIQLAKAVCVAIGPTFLHEINGALAEKCKNDWITKGDANTSIKKRLNCLGRMLKQAAASGLIIKNQLPPVQGLPPAKRNHLWLRLLQINLLLEKCPPPIRLLAEYMVLTGARILEATDFRLGDIRNGKIWIPTEKKGCAMRERMRPLNIQTLGPRFVRLLARMTPHPKTGYYFYAPGGDGTPISYSYYQRLFKQALIDASLGEFVGHDMRGTFAMHRSIIGVSFWDLMAELGHGDPKSIQSYLDRAKQFDPHESIFFRAPAPAANATVETQQNKPNPPPKSTENPTDEM